MREIKYRVWNTISKTMKPFSEIKGCGVFAIADGLNSDDFIILPLKNSILNQYTGLKDKNDVEIYEYMELDNQFEVSFSHGSYILTNISNGDIMTLHKYIKDKNGQVKITKEYTKI